MINQHTIQAARDLMMTQTIKNGAPAWPLTEIAVAKGKGLCSEHHAREDIVVVALYLAHIVFSKDIGGEIQQNHMFLSADSARSFLKGQGVSDDDNQVILNAIQAHHAHVDTESVEAEIVKNAEGFKFLSVQGAQYFLQDLESRGLDHDAAKKELLRKMDQKLSYLTLPDCIAEAKENVAIINKLI